MLRTLECEAAVFGCQAVEAQPTAKGGEPDPTCLLPVPGAQHLFGILPLEHWGLISAMTDEQTAEWFESAELTLPLVVVSSTTDVGHDHLAVAQGLGADPMFCIAIEDTPAGIDAALDVGMKVIGVATTHAPDELAAAEMVIPSLRSLHVVGRRPVLVLEADAIPDVGTYLPGPSKHR